jgi:hypothetical protein
MTAYAKASSENFSLQNLPKMQVSWTPYKNKNRLAAFNFQEKSTRNYKVS